MAARLPAPLRRQQLLDAAVEVFAGLGFHAASMDAVADAAGVTKPVLYQHFSSKRELYLAVLGDVGEHLRETVLEATAGVAHPRVRVEAGFAAYFDFVAEHTGAFRLLFDATLPADPEVGAIRERVEEAVADTVALLIDADVESSHRDLLAHAVIGLAEATARHWVRQGRIEDPARLASRVAELAWAGLRGVHRD